MPQKMVAVKQIDWSVGAVLNGTAALNLHTGNTLQRPADVNPGALRYNSELLTPEVKLPNGWYDILSTYSLYEKRRSAVRTVVIDYSADIYDEIILVASSPRTITLPIADKAARIIIKKVDSGSGAVTIMPRSNRTIDGQPNFQITIPMAAYQFVSDGTNWFVV